MTSCEVTEIPFDDDALEVWARASEQHRNWPVVYTLDGPGEVYVGESLNAAARFKQHLSTDKQRLRRARVVLDDSFNKSVCLDLESHLIRWFAGDGQFEVLNRNDGVIDADYYRRSDYRQTFDDVFEALRARGAFTRSVREIENTDLFKLSPFKALTADQAIAVEDILEGLFVDLAAGTPSRLVIQGDPGTGKTVVAIYLMKLLADIQDADLAEPMEGHSILSEFFVEGCSELLQDFRIGLVVPQQSLRASIQNVFRKTPGLDPTAVMTPFDVAKRGERFDLLVVDETHRLNQRASLASGVLNADFAKANVRLFGGDDPNLTQLDWINAVSQHQIYLLDAAQAVRPADLPRELLDDLTESARREGRHHRLATQMRVQAGSDYVGYVRRVLNGTATQRTNFPGYDLRFFDDLGEMVEEVRAREEEVGLSRILAGYAWPWPSKKDPSAHDIVVGDVRLRWNSRVVDWVNSPKSVEEAGSIHTIQGYDLNIAAVVIGEDLRYDPVEKRVFFDRSNYYDKKGMQNNPRRGISYSDGDLLEYVQNIYAVLLTRGVLGTYVHVRDLELREFLRTFL